ncbi:uncharacterized protein K452DRAFT_292628 [Aplosporella prunicola CBS 121167]|uniref:F-box domain-containing protein n=1 Tax=Aplosporella prunicola CBS 121167 TaxID=1176127 RepID=A0A6A6AYX8_9PEZI|nr:uncharacterized protein K452DRAFT_292628 [Aplosporella prunicola CBS 121167]KAF2136175.1 hypothetical protein K452DRAFT_292628 [Aplosporella prunicola CBS 121167]
MLPDLPFELLSHIVEYLPTAHNVGQLSLTCRKLHAFVDKEGWKIFLRTRFPSYPQDDRPARYSAHSLTTLSRNWDRKAFVSRYIEPRGSITSLNTGKQLAGWEKPRGQTMGFQPSLDSYEDVNKGRRREREEILVWSAGAQLLIRKNVTGPGVEKQWEKASPDVRQRCFDQYHHKSSWFTFKMPGAHEGRDDITCLNILRPWQRESEFAGYRGLDRQSIILGTANGDLNLVNFGLGGQVSARRAIYATNKRSVRATDVSQSSNPLLAAAFSDSTVALYPVYRQGNPNDVESVGHLKISPEPTKTCRIWSTRFLSPVTLAVGLGPSTEPVHVYSVTPTGIAKDPIRKFGIDGTGLGVVDERVDNVETTAKQSSVYSIATLPSTVDPDRNDPNIFLSGGYDGVVRVHDMRSPAAYESCYWDPTDDGAVYALQPIARERLVVGSSRHSMVKFFDLRVGGGRAYHYADVGMPTLENTGPEENGLITDDVHPETGTSDSHGWNLFFNPRNQSHNQRGRSGRAPDRRSIDSPIYALTSPSPFSPSIFAGVENSVIQMDFTSIADPHPDPMYQHALVRTGGRGKGLSRLERSRAPINVLRSWNPRGDVLNLAAYEQSTKQALRLRVQSGVGKYAGTLEGWDERWRDGSEA